MSESRLIEKQEEQRLELIENLVSEIEACLDNFVSLHVGHHIEDVPLSGLIEDIEDTIKGKIKWK